MTPLIPQTLARLISGAVLVLSAHSTAAAPISYTFEGHFTGQTRNDAALIQALGPLLGAGQSIRQTVTFDTAIPSSGLVNVNRTLYRAVTASTVQFAGFQDAVETRFGGCPNRADLICTMQIRDGVGRAPGSFLDPDHISIFPNTLASAALEAASGIGRSLELQFMLFFDDITGQALADDTLDLDLTALDVSGWSGSLGVYKSGANGLEFANFRYSIDRISLTGANGTAIPEPASLALVALALGGLALQRHGTRRTRSR